MGFYYKYKSFIHSGLLSGLLFAIIMAAFDYFKDQPFSLLKFSLHIVLFGSFNGYMAYRKFKKQNNYKK